jgi:hypothetical protein
MKFNVVLTFFAIIIFLSCKNDPIVSKNKGNASTSHASNDRLLGNWLATDFISRAMASASIVNAKNNNMEPYALAFSFNYQLKDSVNCFDSRRNWRLPVRFNVDTVEIKNATSEGKSIFMVYNSGTDQSIDLINTTGASPTIQRFTRTRTAEMDAFTAFNMALNVGFFKNEFTLAGKSGNKVTFLQDGQVTGLSGIDFYRLCTGGDCMVAGEFQDVIYLGNSELKKGDFYGFRSSVQRDSFLIYKMKSDEPIEKKNYKITGTAFTLLRKK